MASKFSIETKTFYKLNTHELDVPIKSVTVTNIAVKFTVTTGLKCSSIK